MPVDTTYTSGEILTAQDLNSSFAECAAVGGPNTFTDLQTFDNGISVTGGTITDTLAVTAATVSLAGATAGAIDYTMPEQGTYKKFVAYANGYENDTTTGQSITFPVAFTNVPVVTTNTSGLTVSVTTTTLTITAPDVTTTYTGYVIVEGF